MLTGRRGLPAEPMRDDSDAGVAVAEPASDEAELVESLRRGDEGAFAEVVRSHGEHLLATARRLLPSEPDAQDAVQEAFLSAFQALDGFRRESRLSTWLHRIVVNAALMRLRNRRRRPERSIEDLLLGFDHQGAWKRAPARYEDPCDALERGEIREWVRCGIDRLPEGYRTVLLLRDILELDTDEAARLLGITPNAVKVRVHRARQALRTLLDAGCDARNRREGPASGQAFEKPAPARRRVAAALR